jgi:hypothetical protein
VLGAGLESVPGAERAAGQAAAAIWASRPPSPLPPPPLTCLPPCLPSLLPCFPVTPCSGRSIKSLKWFFVVSCGLLVFIAAGLVASGVNFFTYAGMFGTLFPYEVRRAGSAVPRCAGCRLFTWAGAPWRHPPPPLPTPHPCIPGALAPSC